MAIVFVALAVRVGAVAYTGFSTAHFGDAPGYLGAAKALAETGRYPLRTDLYYSRPPGYSALLAAVTLGHPERIVVAKITNAALGALATLLLAAVAGRLFRRRAVAIGVGLAAALDPSLVLVSSDIQSEPLFLLCLLTSGFFLLVAVDRPSSNFAVLSGASLGLAALTRPSALAVVPFLLAPLADRRYPWRARAHLAVSALLGLAIALGPWVVRNALVYRRSAPVSDFAAVNFAIGNSDLMLRFCAVRTREGFAAWEREEERWIAGRIAQARSSETISPGAISRALVRRTIAERLADPGGTARLLLCKTRDWIRPYPNPLFWPRSVVLGVGLFYATLYCLGALGLAAAPRRGASLFALVFLLVTMAAHVATLVAWRYRVPYWDPVLLLYGVFGASRSR